MFWHVKMWIWKLFWIVLSKSYVLDHSEYIDMQKNGFCYMRTCPQQLCVFYWRLPFASFLHEHFLMSSISWTFSWQTLNLNIFFFWQESNRVTSSKFSVKILNKSLFFLLFVMWTPFCLPFHEHPRGTFKDLIFFCKNQRCQPTRIKYKKTNVPKRVKLNSPYD